VCLSLAVGDPDWLEAEVLELIEAARFRGFGIETLEAQQPVALLD
jgi:hypothetical protein